MFEKRINIFTGHFGSGKTEVAVNFALKMLEVNRKTAIVDFDIVNPYFRTADVKSYLEEKGVYVITPMYANTNIDVPALPAEINTMFERKEYKVVFDVGGDDLGARVLSRYRDEMVAEDYEMYFVINTKRPMTDTQDKILEMIESIEYSSRLKITKIINNTNLLQDTSSSDILDGHKLIEKVSEKLDIPIGFISGFKESLIKVKEETGLEALYLKKLIKLPWD